MRQARRVLAGLLLAGCAPAVESGSTPTLAGTLEVEVGADSVWLTLHVTNPAAEAVRVTYPSAQRADFEVQTAAGSGVWTWSADRQFAQVVTEERLGAGETVRHRVSLARPAPGEYRAVGRLTSSDQGLELSTPFQVPLRQERP